MSAEVTSVGRDGERPGSPAGPAHVPLLGRRLRGASPTLREIDEAARPELARARRHERPFTLVTLRMSGDTGRNGDNSLRRLEERLGPALRQDDVLGTLPPAHLAVLLVETDRRDAGGFLRRLRDVVGPALASDALVGMASFPEDEVLWPALKEQALAGELPLAEASDDGPPPGGGLEADLEAQARRAARPGRPPEPNASLMLGLSWRRVADLAVVALAAPLVVPLLALLALAIRLDSPGPIFVSHVRLGRGGRTFPLHKLRTMVRDAEEQKESLAHLNVLPWPDFKIPDDPRVTRVGRWLRRTTLDELPQLWNVARGEMTLVGPRACSVAIDRYELWQLERLEATPGLFGRWQAEGRGTSTFAERCRMDIAQIRTATPLVSLAYVGRTTVALLRRGGY